MTDATEPTTTPAKPGYKTTEFWFALAATALSALFASGALTNNTALAIAGMAATVLTALGYKVSRTLVKTAGVLLVVGLAMSQTGCGGSQASRATTIGALQSGIQTATGALRSYEHEHATAIVETAPDLAAGTAALKAFRSKVDKAWLAVDAARAAVDAANTLNDDTSLAGARTALDNAITAITALTGGSK